MRIGQFIAAPGRPGDPSGPARGVPAGDGPDALDIWPASTRPEPDGGLSVGGVPLTDIAARFGTPTYVLDEEEVRLRCRRYRAAFPDADVVYAAKAFLCRGVATWVREEGLGVDACSAGELQLARASGVPAERIVLHGNAKTPTDLRAALRLGVGRVVVDSLGEIARVAAEVPRGARQQVLIRVVPEISAGGHRAVRTGTVDQQFGVAAGNGTLDDAVERIRSQPGLELVGLHCHLGSQITDVEPFLQAVRRMAAVLRGVRDRFGIVLPQLDLGGGHGIAYRPGDPELDIEDLGARVTRLLREECAAVGLPVPRLTIEPGRAVIGPAGVALYHVVSVKRTPQRTWVAIDGGMSDNPRPALYGQRYTPRLVRTRTPGAVPAQGEARVTVVGRHCEAGDVVADDVPMPADVRAGDLLALPVAGAYHLSMASAYNMVGRPPVVAVQRGRARLLVRRESVADLISRDVGL